MGCYIFANRLAKFVGSVVSIEQSVFIKGRQILDGPLMLNEIVAWFKRQRKELMIFKVDFEKAFDSVSWDYIIEILRIMGFGDVWCSWIRAVLTSARASVLVNGSPTDEFSIQRGLRQGDPLSPFLFIIAMEGLHVVLQQAKMANVLHGVRVGRGELEVSHFFYADDAVVLCEWSLENARCIVRILRCFFLASGLKINLLKSKLIGVGVASAQVQEVAGLIGCDPIRLPFIYLGLPVGDVMSRVKAWQGLLDRFTAKLSVWKAKTLSIGGRLTLLKSVLGSLGSYYMSVFVVPVTVLKALEALRAYFFWGADVGDRKLHWIRWSRVSASKQEGGLGVGSLWSFNRAMLFKWCWRFLHDTDSLWGQL